MAGRRFYVEMVGAAGTGWGCNVTAGYLVYRGLNDYLNVEGTMGWVHRDFTLRLSCMRRISYINWAHSRYIIGGSGIVIDEILNIFSFNHPLVGICTDVRMGDFVLGKVPVYLRGTVYLVGGVEIVIQIGANFWKRQDKVIVPYANLYMEVGYGKNKK